MKINRVSEEMKVPEWAFRKDSPVGALPSNRISSSAVKDFADRMVEAASLSDENAMVMERDAIERCAASNRTYCCSERWSKEILKELKEYATICGLHPNRFAIVEPTSLTIESNDSSEMVRTASAETNVLNIGDPFHLDTAGDTSHLYKGKWEDVTKEQKLKDHPVLNGGIAPIRGGEDYFTHKQERTATWENSIGNPNAIDEFVNDEKEDNGSRLKREREEKELAKKTNHSEWEQEILDSMKERDLLPHGKVFPTESMNAQSGLNTKSSQQRVYNTYEKEDVPDRTLGEKLAEINENQRKSIQREQTETEEWDALKKSPTRMISDLFADELKKALNN